MPYEVTVIASRAWTDGLTDAEREIVERFVAAARGDDQTAGDLDRDLEALASDAPNARVWR